MAIVPDAKNALKQFKMEAAREVGVNLQDGGYNGNLTARENGSVGGQMVKNMIKSMEDQMSNGSY